MLKKSGKTFRAGRLFYKGKVTGDEINFTRQVGEYATEVFIVKREKAEAPSAASKP